mgnify:CR=1 FL=1|tara:strand:+ start:67841 stop:68620 length:780 start_codon:yes stop_codon:yes gene_type:complete
MGDLHNPEAMRTLVAGCDAVIHAAGAVRGSRQSDFDKVNVDGTQALVQTLLATAPEARLLLVSSLAAREPQLSWYAQSKRAGEERIINSSLKNYTILRPPAVYGPGDQEMAPIFEWMSRGIAPVPGATDARLSLIHVDDLTTAAISVLLSDTATRQVFALSDSAPNGYNWHDLAAIAGEVYGRTVRLWQIPGWLLDGAAAANLRLARLTGNAPILTPAKLRELRHPDWVADNQLLFQRTGWRPEIDLRTGLQSLDKAAL